MLRLLEGSYEEDKTAEMFSYIVKGIDEGKNILVIVPDQFSFEYDKQLYKYLGAQKFNSLDIKSFERLSESILRLYGTQKGEYADDNTKQLIMYLAIKQMKKNKCACFYTKQLDKPEFISSVLDIVKDFRHSEIAPSDMTFADNSFTGALGDKINDLSYLYSTYCDILSEKGYKDSLTIIGEAGALSLNNDYFKSKTVFIDKFNSFSPDEMSVVESILSCADEVTVSLTIGNGDNRLTSLSPFANVVKTEYALTQKAKECLHEVNTVRVTDKVSRTESLSHISANIFNPVRSVCKCTEGIKVIPCNDMYEESEYVCAQIKHLVCDKGYSYKDIAVVSRQLTDYTSVLPPVLERYDIPYFMDIKKPVSQKALMLYVMSVIRACATNHPDTENILMLMKSTLSGYSEVDVSRLEDYCFQWNVNGDMWLNDFIGKTSSQSDDYLKAINDIRRSVIEPVMEFKNKCTDRTAAQMCRALYSLFDELKLPVIMSDIINSENSRMGDGQNAVEIAREFKQLWGLLTSAVRCIYNVLGNEKITFHAFYDILSQLLFNSTISTPPQKLDAVTVASADRSMLSDIKTVFVIGVNDGVMPKHYKESGLFTDRDKEALQKLGLVVSRRTVWKLAEERLTTYRALSSASESMYVCYPLSDTGVQVRRPSSVIRQIINMFDETVVLPAWDMDDVFYCCTMHSAYNRYCEIMSSHTAEARSIETVLRENEEYSQRLRYLEDAKLEREYSISASASGNMFFENNLNISATKVESYFKCPFAFFCSDGLKIRPNRAIEIDPMNKGTIVHYCLEKIISKTENNKQVFNSDFLNFTEESIQKKVRILLAEYKKKELGGDFGKTKRFEALLDMLVSLITDVLLNIRNELNKADCFVPHEFEYNLSTSGNSSIFELPLDSKTKIILRGKIDRVDIYEENNKSYVRIIDYKTGTKDFDLADVYHGINMQMLLYLMAVTDNVSQSVPVGVLYIPAKDNAPKLDRGYDSNGFDKETVLSEKAKLLRRNGLVIRSDNDKVMKSMTDSKYVAIRNARKPDGFSSILPADSFVHLEEFAKGKLLEMACKLRAGEIPTAPLMSGTKPACEFCDYWSICGRRGNVPITAVVREDADKLRAEIGIDAEKEEDSDVD